VHFGVGNNAAGAIWNRGTLTVLSGASTNHFALGQAPGGLRLLFARHGDRHDAPGVGIGARAAAAASWKCAAARSPPLNG